MRLTDYPQEIRVLNADILEECAFIRTVRASATNLGTDVIVGAEDEKSFWAFPLPLEVLNQNYIPAEGQSFGGVGLYRKLQKAL